jgi:hypothetical protein
LQTITAQGIKFNRIVAVPALLIAGGSHHRPVGVSASSELAPTVVLCSIRKAIWGVTMLTNRTFRMTPWDMCDLQIFFVFTPFFDPNLGKFRVTSRGPFAQKPCDADLRKFS